MKSLALVLPVAALLAASGRAQQAGPALPPLPRQVLRDLARDPQAWEKFLADHAQVPEAEPSSMEPLSGLAWKPLENLLPGTIPPQPASNPLLLTDGTVLVHVSCTFRWYRLKPDVHGNYQKGHWSLIAPMIGSSEVPYTPRFFSSAILPDGRVVVEGGEYGGPHCKQLELTAGSIYDPRNNSWTPVSPPSGWTEIGDASGMVLNNGAYLLSNPDTKQTALLNAEDLTWTPTGSGKFDKNSEENWTLLPNGDVLTVDAYVNYGGPNPCGTHSEEYQPALGNWVTAGSTINELSGCSGSIPTYEAPTQILRPNGTVTAFGATASLATQNLPVYTAIYNTATQEWSAGPKMPQVGGVYYTMADAPAAILPNGKVLIAASPGEWATGPNGGYPHPTHFFIFDGSTFTQVGDVADSASLHSYQMNFLVLPTGEVLGVETDKPNMEIFPAVCCANPSWAPTISTFPATIVQGETYTISGTQFNGMTEGAVFGDDVQASTNFPLVRVTNTSSQQVSYCVTFNFSSMGVATGSASVSTDFTCDAPPGASTLEVVSNGIASMPVNVVIQAPSTITLYNFCSQGGSDCTDGDVPIGGLIMDTAGNLYGTTVDGGTNTLAGGTVFELPFNAATQQYAGAVQILYSFCAQTNCTDGKAPNAGLVMDSNGNLFGTTSGGGTGGNGGGGTLFELAFDAATNKYAAAVQTLYSFCSASDCADGTNPAASLIIDESGNLFGTTLYNGNRSYSSFGAGTMFELPYDAATKQYASTIQTLYSFCSQPGCVDGSFPAGALILDDSGNLYGATSGGGAGNGGALFEVPYDAATKQYAGAVQILYSFCSQANCADGQSPTGLIMDDFGNLYGAAEFGGIPNGASTVGGALFELPFDTATQAYAGAVQILYTFCSLSNCADGQSPYASVIMDDVGNLYGTTHSGGSGFGGTAFELPFNPATQEYAAAVQTLYDFCLGCATGYSPQVSLLMDGLSGTLYGATSSGGTNGGGTLFKLTQ